MKDEIKETHESYGMLRFSRFSGGNNIYFGSSITHSGGISLTIKRGGVARSLKNDWYFGKDVVCEIEMSPSQFAEAITNMNCGDGVPCTIKYLTGKKMENPPFTNKRLQFEKEFKHSFDNLIEELKAITENAENLLSNKKPLNMSEKKEIISALQGCAAFMKYNLPFINQQFNEQMDKTVKEAKGEVDNLITHSITRLGIEKLNELKQLTSNSEAKQNENL